MVKNSFDSDLVRSLAALLDETNLSELEYETQGLRVRVARQLTVAAAVAPQYAPAPAAPVAAAAVAASDDGASHPGCVKSPMVGVVYFSPEPGAAAFIKQGDVVSEGQTLCLIEAMKTFNPIRAPKSGKITRIIVADAHPVEFGEPLMIIE